MLGCHFFLMNETRPLCQSRLGLLFPLLTDIALTHLRTFPSIHPSIHPTNASASFANPQVDKTPMTGSDNKMMTSNTSGQVGSKRKNTKQRRMKERKAQQDAATVSDTSSMSSEDSRPMTRRLPRKKNKSNNNNNKGKNNRKQKNKRSKTQHGDCSDNSSNGSVADIADDEKARYLALDCEMVGVGVSGHKSSLARVCIVDWNGDIVLDEFVRQTETVTDYRTFVSGITAEHLTSEMALSFDDCRTKVLSVLEGKILVGHALKGDLRALQITHPWYNTRDTGKYEPFMKVRFDDGILWPRKLKELAKEKLGRDVQQEGVAHCPWEDATTAMALYKLVRRKWEKAMTYKYNKTMEIEGRKTQQQLLPPVQVVCAH